MHALGRLGRAAAARTRDRDSRVSRSRENRRSPRPATHPQPGTEPLWLALPRESRPPAAMLDRSAILGAPSIVLCGSRLVRSAIAAENPTPINEINTTEPTLPHLTVLSP